MHYLIKIDVSLVHNIVIFKISPKKLHKNFANVHKKMYLCTKI